MAKKWLVFIIALLVTIVLAATNPGFAQHKDVILSRLHERQAQGDGAPVGVAAPGAHMRLRYNNYVLFSTASVGGKTATIGVAGLVVSLLR